MSEIFEVYFLSSNVHSCFFYLCESDLRSTKSNKRAIKIRFGPHCQKMTYGFISSTALAEIPIRHIGVSSLYANKLGLEENNVVIVSYCDVDSIGTLQMIPKKEEDYVILVSCKSILETYLLNQLSVVAEGQILPVYVFSNISIDVEIGKMDLASGYGQLKKFTEIIVLHPSEKSKNTFKTPQHIFPGEETAKAKKNLMKLIYNNMNNMLSQKNDLFQIDLEKRQEIVLKNLIEGNLESNRGLEYKIQPSFLLTCDLPEKIQNKFIVVSSLESKNCFGSYSVKILAQVKKVIHGSKEKFESHDKNKEEFLFVNTHVISLNNNNLKNAFCPPYIMKKLKLYVGSKITIKQLKPSANILKTKVPRMTNCNSKFCQFWKSIAEIRDNVKQTIINNFKYNHKINILIIGGSGTGKTFLLGDILNEFTDEFIYCKLIQCKPLRGKKIESLQKLLIENLNESVCQEPSLIFLDDLHALTYIDDEENLFNRLFSDRIVDLISNILEDFQKKYNITVIASAASLPGLSAFVTRHGPRLFQNVLTIPELNCDERNFALRTIMCEKFGVTNDCLLHLDKLSNSTNGYSVRDLSDLLDRAIFNCILRNETETLLDISEKDFELALSELTPFYLRNIKLKSNIKVKWDEVGGLTEPKKILTEIFSWPLKYPNLLGSCPLRLQRGVLLYGAPGTGKTLLAGALALKCDLNFISVKGPEILSKYVGASEEGVRNLFVQAQKNQPCLLFFDEFDSLAPKRGHSSTGVTDRVVNQMLTQLDGVESLNGVWILAATSRPDLLDPALLRPGRLDKLVYCTIPNQVDRLSILEVLSKDLVEREDVNLSEIAEKTEGYTGADLQAILVNAQMCAIKETKNLLGKSSDIRVQKIHFLRALAEVKPSLSHSEKERYEEIYERFLGFRKKNFPKSFVGEQKVTLA